MLSAAEDGEQAAHVSARNFDVKIGGHYYSFADFWEHDLTTFCGRYIWACYAITWGIDQYDRNTADVDNQPAIAEKDAPCSS